VPTETFPATAQDTTATLYAQIAAAMAHTFPTEASRIERALSVLATRRILETGECGVYLVQSSDNPILYYQATSLRCCCRGAQRWPERRCSHAWAIDIIHTASAVQAREAACAASQDVDIVDADPDSPIPFEITERGLAALATPVATGEAACPRCGRVRGVVFDGDRTRWFGCHTHRIPQPPLGVPA
jgi:hypothetical protein